MFNVRLSLYLQANHVNIYNYTQLANMLRNKVCTKSIFEDNTWWQR